MADTEPDPEARHGQIRVKAGRLLAEMPDGVLLVAAAKGRSAGEVRAAISGGISCIGHNYVHEASLMRGQIGQQVSWHLIGHLQRNKAKAALEAFDMVETLDSWRLATVLERRCSSLDRRLPVLVEVNIAREASKSGAFPEDVPDLVGRLATLDHLSLEGLMTIGPAEGDLEAHRSCFRMTRELFERLRDSRQVGDAFRQLSMGMSDSWPIAVDEGATMVRIGTALFGSRPAG